MKIHSIFVLSAWLVVGVKASDYEDGMAHLHGTRGRPDFVAAREKFERASSRGDALAMLQLGILWSKGLGGPCDDKRALELFSRAGEAGQREALYNQGIFLLQGRGAEHDLQRGLQCLIKSAASGSLHAHVKLADLFYFGTQGLRPDRKQALPHIKAAAEMGNAWACNILGTMAEYGYEMPMDRGVAIQWFTVAANQGDTKAQGNLGRMLKQGKPTQDNRVQAYQWLKLAAEKGDAMAKFLLADHVMCLSSQQISEGDRRVSDFIKKSVTVQPKR